MAIIYSGSTKLSQLQQILDQQQQNLITNVTDNEKEKEGFVTVAHTLEQLTAMNAACPHIIAQDQGKVVGYALCMHPQFGSDIKVLKPMFNEISKVIPREASYIVMGQICIDKTYRRQGIFRKLYEAMKSAVQPRFKHIITEVDASNQRSLNAHYAVGFRDLKTYSAGGQDWKLIVLD